MQTLERCNSDNIKSLERIVGVDRKGNEVHELYKNTEEELRAAGDLWSEHILENAKAYIMSFVYIIVTVTIGFPLISGITYAAGLREDKSPGDRLFYLTRFFDALIYFWLPQINIFIVSASAETKILDLFLLNPLHLLVTAPLVPRSQFASPNGRKNCGHR